MSNPFFKIRAEKTIFGLYFLMASRQIKDSKMAYWWIFIISAVYFLWAWHSLCNSPKGFFELINGLIKQSVDFFNLFPPFLLTIIAIFPAFTGAAKEKLKELKLNGEPRIASFIDQFVFLLLTSIFLLVYSKILVSSDIFIYETQITSDKVFWLLFLSTSFVSILLALSWEVIDSTKSLYMLILLDYKV